nr:hypothetical protein [Microbispora camponoti]
MGGVEALRPVGEPLGPVDAELLDGRVRQLDRQALRVVLGAHDERQHRRDEGDPGDPVLTMPGQVASHLGAAGRMPDDGHVTQVEVLDQTGDVIGEGVEVVTGTRPIGATVPAPVEQHASVSLLHEERHLVLPHIGGQRPTRHEHDGLAGSVVLVGQAGAVGSIIKGHRHNSLVVERGLVQVTDAQPRR